MCDISHRRSVAVLCMLYKNRCKPMHPLNGALPGPYAPMRVTRNTRKELAAPVDNPEEGWKGVALETHWRCTGDGLETHWRCIGDALQLHLRRTADTLETHCRCTSV